MHARGFTILELLITLIILALLMTIGIPSFAYQVQNTKLKTTALSLLEAVELTRSKAVFTNKRVVVRNQDEWSGGWEIFMDANDNGVQDENEEILQTHEKIDGVRIISNTPLKNYISFIGSGESRYAGRANGGGFQAGTFKVCPKTKGDGYTLILARGGRMRMDKITADECDAS
jgi:type IV fimbrial biogenesis protein FimT